MCQRAASLTVTPACGRRCDSCNTSDAWKEVMQVAAPVRPACGRLAGVADAWARCITRFRCRRNAARVWARWHAVTRGMGTVRWPTALWQWHETGRALAAEGFQADSVTLHAPSLGSKAHLLLGTTRCRPNRTQPESNHEAARPGRPFCKHGRGPGRTASEIGGGGCRGGEGGHGGDGGWGWEAGGGRRETESMLGGMTGPSPPAHSRRGAGARGAGHRFHSKRAHMTCVSATAVCGACLQQDVATQSAARVPQAPERSWRCRRSHPATE